MFEYRQYLYASSSEALTELKLKGYDFDFNLSPRRLIDYPEDFKIIYVIKYEGDSSPEDSSTVYGIECISTREKGVFVMGNPSNETSAVIDVFNLLEIEGRTCA